MTHYDTSYPPSLWAEVEAGAVMAEPEYLTALPDEEPEPDEDDEPLPDEDDEPFPVAGTES